MKKLLAVLKRLWPFRRIKPQTVEKNSFYSLTTSEVNIGPISRNIVAKGNTRELNNLGVFRNV